MNEQRNNGRGIFYGVIGVATLVVAIVGATFAYFTATAYTTERNITGNMATVSLGLAVEKVTHVDEAGGMVPMSSGMVEAAVNNENNEICVDDSGNAVCQVYKITVSNTSSAAQFVDGYLALKGGSGTANDVTTWVNSTADATLTSDGRTTMRWAQVFSAGAVTEGNHEKPEGYDSRNFTTVGTQDLGGAGYTHYYASLGDNNIIDDSDSATTGKLAFTSLQSTTDGKNTSNIVETGTANAGYNSVIKGATIYGSDYVILGKNYIRVSDHTWGAGAEGKEVYNRQSDITSALVFNQYLAANTGSMDFYIVLWLAETGTNQTANADEQKTNPDDLAFFSGNVTFNSATGSEVSASFSGLTKAYSKS